MISYFLVLAILFAAVQSQSQEAIETKNTTNNNDGDDDYIDLVDMTHEELEEICTSRGFELIREDGQVYLHQDYVDAASECLQIETDLEEILQKNPQILNDVKRESERMMDERDRLLSQLKETQADDAITDSNIDDGHETQGDHTLTKQESHGGDGGRGEDEGTEEEQSIDNSKGELTDTETTTSNNQPIYTFKEITMEVIEQMRTDITKFKNFIIPERLQKQIQPILDKHVMPVLKVCTEQYLKPAAKTLVSVAKDMCISVVDLIKRHATALNNSGRGGKDQTPVTSN